jgi:ABC-2 type transport system ATP-binding protein
MIEVRNLAKIYGDVAAVDNVSFAIGRGEVVGFLGPNGAGKSTTMKILTGYLPATRGTAVVAGFDVFDRPMEVKRRIGYLPEHPPLYPDLTVREYLRFVGRLKGLRGSALTRNLDRVIERISLATVADRLIRNISKGFQQRTGLAQALLGNPEVLILDEPTIGMDPRQIGEVRALIQGLAGEHTVILSTHILQEVTAVCQRAIIINRGHLVADEDLATLTGTSNGNLEQVFLSLTEM